MWRNPKYFPPDAPAATSAPPEPSGQLVAAFDRQVKGQRQQLRVSLDEYQGHPYVSVRLWECSRDGRGWFPTKKGVSVRVGELAGVAEALEEALALAGGRATAGQRQPEPARWFREDPGDSPRYDGPPEEDPGY